MRAEEFLRTIKVNGIDVAVGMDDYGQCFFFEYEKNGKTYEEGCGTYNINYLEYIFYALDPVYKELVNKDLFGELDSTDKAKFEEYKQLIRDEYDNEESYRA